MTSTRRDFIKTVALTGGALAAAPAAAFAGSAARAAAPMRLLILGGTGFIGPHLVRHAISRGHHLTIFTRGRRDGELPDNVERLVGDRDGQLDALAGGKWDAVIDDSATNLDWVKQSTALLKDSVGRYLFTSSTGVYYPYLTARPDEAVQPHGSTIDPKDSEETYGVAKTKCEAEVLRVFGDRGLVVRPTYIVGPGDTTDRFPYWAARLPQGGDVLAPGRRDDPVQWVDVRDLVAFYVKLLEDQRTGTFNGVAAACTVPSRDFYNAVHKTLNPKATMVYVDDYQLLEKNGIAAAVPWIMLTGPNLYATSIATSKSAAAGLHTRPLAETLRDTAAWWPTVPEARRLKPRFTISSEVEARVLATWKTKKETE